MLFRSATVFYELFTLHHPLDVEDKSLIPMLMEVTNGTPKMAFMYEDPTQGRIPSELAYFLDRGLKKKPELVLF